MHETDDRLAGDPVWELFPRPSPGPAHQASRTRRNLAWLAVGGVVAAVWFVHPPSSVLIACLSAAARDVRNGRRLARSIPDKAGGRVCALFTYAWGAWKSGVVAFLAFYVTISLSVVWRPRHNIPPNSLPPEGLTAILLWLGAFVSSAILSALGLWKAYRSGMRVWIGEGVNRARMLLLVMLLVGFTLFVLIPWCLGLTVMIPREAGPGNPLPLLLTFLGIMFVGPVLLLIALDRASRHVVADRPSKFGPKVPTVGKWDP